MVDGYLSDLSDHIFRMTNVVGTSVPAPVEVHLRIPAGAVSLGGAFGLKLWSSPEAQKLIVEILKDPVLAGYYLPPPDSALAEVRGRIAAFIQAALASDDARKFCTEKTADLAS